MASCCDGCGDGYGEECDACGAGLEGVYRRRADGATVRPAIRTADDVERFGWEPVDVETHGALDVLPTAETAELRARNVYALSKRYQEELAASLGAVYGFPVVCLRLFNVYGPRQALTNPYTGVLAIFLSRLLEGRRPLYDALGPAYTLLRFDPTTPVTGLVGAAANRRVPLTVLDVQPPQAYDLYRRRLVLVRPDQHVAWRGDEEPAAPLALIDIVRGALSETPRPPTRRHGS
jgi:hypothetical protein